MIDRHFSEHVVHKVSAVLLHVIKVLLDVLILLQCLSQVAQPVVGGSQVVLEPHGLHFVAVQISICILFAKLSHGFLSKLDIVNLKNIFGAQGIQVSVGLIEVSGELSQDHGLFLVACELHDLGLVCIQLNNCRGVRDSFIDV